MRAVDPDWQPREALPSCERYVAFTPPPHFRDGMLADSGRWGPEVARSIQRAIANAISWCVWPRLVDFEAWVAHATGFFQRVCAHRRSRGTTVDAAILQLQQRVGACERAADAAGERFDLVVQRVAECERAIAGLRVSIEAAGLLQATSALHGSEKAASAVSELRMGRSQSPRGRGRESQPNPLPLDTRVMLAQVAAAQARSPSPAICTREALEEFMARRTAGEARCSSLPPGRTAP